MDATNSPASIHRVDSIDDARLAPFRNLRDRGISHEDQLFVCEGRWVVERLLQSELTTQSLLVSEGHGATWLPQCPTACQVYELPRSQISQLVGFDFHRGVLACAIRPKIHDASQLTPAKMDPLCVLLCDVREPENVGVILRSCAAFGVRQVVICASTASPFRRRVVRVSMASVFEQTFYRAESCRDWLSSLTSAPYFRAIASCLDSDATDLADLPVNDRKTILIVGNEATGLPDDIKSLADHRVRVPMQSDIDSLNVAAATTVFLYQLSNFGGQR